mgnify:CR=1 FL=1
MKKRIAYSLASVVAASALGFSAMPAYAQSVQTQTTVVQTKEIKDPQDFVDLYCSFKKVTVDAKKQETITYTVYETVTEKNYEQILSGKSVYDTLDEKMQKAINEILKNTKNKEEKPLEKDYTNLYEEALLVQQEVKEKEDAKKEDAVKEEQETTNPKQDENEIEKDQPASDESLQESEDTTKDNEEIEEPEKTEVSDSDVEEDTQDVVDQDSNEVEEPADDKTSDTIEAPVITPKIFLANAEPLEESLLVSAIQATPNTIEQGKVSLVSQDVKTTTEEKKESVTPVTSNALELNSLDQDVQNFIKNYLMDTQGNLYTSVTMYNYRQILSGVSSYSDLSTDKVSQLNSYLLAKGSQRYFSLVNQCQHIENQGSTLTRRPGVDTSSASGFGLYGALMALSSVGFGFLIKRKKEKNV